MRWLFLVFIALVWYVGNAALLSEPSVQRVLGTVPFNLFAISLASIWVHAYYRTGAGRARGLVLSHTVLMFSAGLALLLIGSAEAVSGSCEVLAQSTDPSRLRGQVTAFVKGAGLCREFGVILAALGVIVALPSIRLFVGLRSGA